MLDQLFGSKTRAHVLAFLFRHARQDVYPQEVVTAMHTDPANTLREFQRLEAIGVLVRTKAKGRRYYHINTESEYYEGLAGLFGQGDNRPTLFPMHGVFPEDRTNDLRGKEWYHQRFDACPIFIGSIAESELRQEPRKPSGTEADIRICFYGEGKGDWYLDEADIRRGATVLTGLAKSDPEISKKLLAAWKVDEDAFQRYVDEEFPGLPLRELKTVALAKEWRRFYRLGIDRFTSSALIDHFALGTDRSIRDMLRQEVFSTLQGKQLQESALNEIFAIATAPIHQSFINQAEIELLRIALGTSKETVVQFSKRYSWMHNNYYEAHTLAPAHFRKEVRAWKKSGKDLAHECATLEETPVRNKQQKEALFRKFKFSQELRTLLIVSEDFTWWQDERKRATYRNIEIGSTFLKEIARRTGYSVDELKYCVASEIATILTKKHPSRKELQNRQRGCVVLATREGYWIATGRAMQTVKETMFAGRPLDTVQDVRGLSANTGRAVGTVKVVLSATEIAKVKKGDILVAVMTRPDYVAAMRKAGAIVTNEGGITSHAAIVSRELGIPCIIGTKIATEIFKDGDLVEVNANHGWIRKVQA